MELIVIGIVVIGVVVGCSFLSLRAYRSGGKAGYVWLGLVWTAFTFWQIFAMSRAEGWDATGYLIGLVLLSAPAAVGIVAGALIGWRKQRKTSGEPLT